MNEGDGKEKDYGIDVRRANIAIMMYIQYFWKNDFSGSGLITSPSAVSGGGVTRVGLVKKKKG
jgi:hypothetical protein